MIAQFALRLICGMSWMWVAMPRRQVTSGFFRIQMLVVLGLSVLAGLTSEAPRDGAAAPASSLVSLAPIILMGILAFCGSVVWTLGRRGAGDFFVFAIAGVAAAKLVLAGARMFGSSRGEWFPYSVIGAVSELSSALLLGASVTGMLLGHWYLTAPTMSTAPLNRLNIFLGAAAVLRLAVSATMLVQTWSQLAGPTQFTWLALRWFAGILGPLVVSLMAWRILKYRNTQSATGVLFVGVILVFIGDMSGSLLSHELGVPL